MDGSWCPPRSLYPMVASYFVSGFKSKNLVLGLEFSRSSALPSCGMWFLYVEIFSLYFELNLIACVICTTGVCSVCVGGVGGVYVGGGTARIGLGFYKISRIVFALVWNDIGFTDLIFVLENKKTLKEINQNSAWCWRSLNSIPFFCVRVYLGQFCILFLWQPIFRLINCNYLKYTIR
jgi:hypothetical protein